MIPCIVTFKKVRAIYFRIKPDRVLYITCSSRYQEKIESIILSKSKWILRHYRKISQQKKIISSNHIYYLGTSLILFTNQIKTGEQRVVLGNGDITLFLKNLKKADNMIDKFLKKATDRYVSSILPFWSQKTGLIPNKVSFRKMKKWGSCNKKGKIVFNSFLICLPPALIEYIVCHELIHLIHFDHSHNFHQAVAKYLPDLKKLEKDLKMYVR